MLLLLEKVAKMQISTKDSKVGVYVIPTNEELAIARETVSLITKS